MKLGIGFRIPYEPILKDAGTLPPGSWDIVLEAGVGVDALVRSEVDELLLIESAA